MDDATVAAIRQALIQHKVVFFRDQSLDETGHEAFGRLLGDLVPHPTVPSLDGTAGTLDIDGSRGDARQFLAHRCDLRCELSGDLDPPRGDASRLWWRPLWANTAAAYAELPGGFARPRGPALGRALERLRLRRRAGERVRCGRRRYDEVFTRTVFGPSIRWSMFIRKAASDR